MSPVPRFTLVPLGELAAPGPEPCGLATDGTWLWCSDGKSDRVYGIDMEGEIRRQFASPRTRSGLAYYRRTLFQVAGEPRELRLFDRGGTELRRLPLPPYGERIRDIDVRKETLGMALDGPPAVEFWSLREGRRTGTGDGCDAPGGFAWDARGLWLSDRRGELLYRPERTSATERYRIGGSPGAIAADRRGSLWVIDLSRGSLLRFGLRRAAPNAL